MKRDWPSSSYSPGQVAISSSSAPGGTWRSRTRSSTPAACISCGIDFSSCRDDQPAHIVMTEIGAAAHGLHGSGVIAFAQRQQQQLFDETGA
jgi:hypothetical protein